MDEEKRFCTESQIAKVKKHLESGKTITPHDAVKLYRAWRLGAIIFVLRHEYGMNIKTTMTHGKNPQFGTRFQYAKYSLVKTKNEGENHGTRKQNL